MLELVCSVSLKKINFLTNLKRIAVSIAFGTSITALAYSLYSYGGELVAVPGMIISGFVDLIAYNLNGPDEFPHLLSWQSCNVVFYSVVVYVLLSVRRALVDEKQKEPQSKGTVRL